MRAAREGEQTGEAEYREVMRTEEAISESRCGVREVGWPRLERSPQPRSSASSSTTWPPCSPAPSSSFCHNADIISQEC